MEGTQLQYLLQATALRSKVIQEGIVAAVVHPLLQLYRLLTRCHANLIKVHHTTLIIAETFLWEAVEASNPVVLSNSKLIYMQAGM